MQLKAKLFTYDGDFKKYMLEVSELVAKKSLYRTTDPEKLTNLFINFFNKQNEDEYSALHLLVNNHDKENIKLFLDNIAGVFYAIRTHRYAADEVCIKQAAKGLIKFFQFRDKNGYSLLDLIIKDNNKDNLHIYLKNISTVFNILFNKDKSKALHVVLNVVNNEDENGDVACFLGLKDYNIEAVSALQSYIRHDFEYLYRKNEPIIRLTLISLINYTCRDFLWKLLAIEDR